MNFLRQYWEIVLIVFALVFHHSTGLTTFYTTDFCSFGGYALKGTINLGSTSSGTSSSAILKATRGFSYPANLNCNITIQPAAFHGVVVSIRKIDFRIGCVDSIQIIDASGSSRIFCSDIYDFNSRTSMSSAGKMTLLFKTGSAFVSNIAGDEYELTLTAYKSTPCYSQNEYRCSNSRCIYKYLTCDNRNHCGDMSDNSDCGYYNGSPVGKIVGSVFGTIFLIVAIIALIIRCLNRRNRIVTTTTVHQPPPPQYVQQPYPGSYPPPQYMAGPQPHGEAVNPLYR